MKKTKKKIENYKKLCAIINEAREKDSGLLRKILQKEPLDWFPKKYTQSKLLKDNEDILLKTASDIMKMK